MSKTEVLFGLGVMLVGACLAPFIGYVSAIAGLILGLALIVAGVYNRDTESRTKTFFGGLPRIAASTVESKQEIANIIGGPQLAIGFETGAHAPLVILNHSGGGWAHNVELRIGRDDGSEIYSGSICIPRDDDRPTNWISSEGHLITAEDIIMEGLHESPAKVRCVDGDGRWLEYHFEPTDRLRGYRFLGKQCLGRIKPPS